MSLDLPTSARFAGAVLCGGASRRMGRDKAGLKLDGVTLLQRAVDRLRAAGAAPVLVVSRLGELSAPGAATVADSALDCGPLGGLVAALRSAPWELCAVVAVDMPDLSAPLLRLLVDRWSGEDAVVPTGPRGPEPLHAVYAASALPAAEAALESRDHSLRGLLAALRVGNVDVAAELGPSLAASFALNLNRPPDVAAWRRRRAASGPPPR
ncbi:MAG: molybdenum cofactor guanylyltransferase [Candidatus Dormibacteria bacterium]